jgi:hypothetical protein
MRALRGSVCFNPDCTMLVATTNRYDDGQYKWLASTTVFDLASGGELAAMDHDGDPTPPHRRSDRSKADLAGV